MLIFKENIYKSGLVDTETYNTELWEIGKSPYKNGLYDTTPYNTPLYGDKIIESETRDEILTLLSRSIVDPSLFAQYDSTTADRPPQPGRCYNFDGVDDHIISSLSMGEYKSISFLIKLDEDITSSTVGKPLLSKNITASETAWIGSYGGHILNETLHIGFGASSGSYITETIPAGIRHIYFEWNGSYYDIYIDGELKNSIVYGTNQVLSNFNIYIFGRTVTNQYAKAKLLDFRIFDVELNADQKQELFQNKIVTGLNSLVHYKCDEGAGTIAYDSSGNGNHGTITNATLSTFHATDKDICYSWQNNVGYSQYTGLKGTTLYRTDVIKPSHTGDYSVAMKVYLRDVSPPTLVLWYSPTGAFRVFAKQSGILSVYNGAWKSFGTSFPSAGAHSFVFTFKAGTNECTAYIDGIKTNSTIILNAASNLNSEYSLFREQLSSSGVIGLAEEVSFYDSILTDEDALKYHQNILEKNYVEKFDFTKETVIGDKGIKINLIDNEVGAVKIPRNESETTLDALNSPLQHTGKALYNADLAQSNCATFDGVDDYVLTTFSPTSRHSVTMGGWVKPGSDYSVNRMILGGTLAKYYLRFQPTTKQVIFTTVGVKDYIFSYAAIDNVWVHLVVVFNSDFSADLYVNGKFNQKITGVAQATSNTYNLAIGGSPTVWNFLGSLSNIFFAERVLSSTEIKSMYENNIPDNIDFIIPLAEGVGTTAYDVSGNGNHGTATNITESTFWGTKQDVYHYNIKEGMSKYMYFDGVDDYIELSNNFNHTNTGFSIYLDISADEANQYVMSQTGSPNTYMLLGNNSVSLFIRQLPGTTHNSINFSHTLDFSKPNKLLFNINSGNSTLYVNGVLVSTNNNVINTPVSYFSRLGRYVSSYTKGNIIEAAFYNNVLTPAQAIGITSGESLSVNSSYSNVWGHWKNTGNTNADWVDLSGNGNDGTVNGSPTNIYVPAKADKLKDALENDIQNPAGNYHNGAETKLKYPNTPELQVANDAQGSDWIFDASDIANAISYSDIVANVNNNDYILSDVSKTNQKTGPVIFNPALEGAELQRIKTYLNH